LFTPLTQGQNVRLYRMVMVDHECPWGLKAEALLKQQNIAFEDIHLTTNDEVDAFKRSHGVVTTPQIFLATNGLVAIPIWLLS